jgi:hypothetical protein
MEIAERKGADISGEEKIWFGGSEHRRVLPVVFVAALLCGLPVIPGLAADSASWTETKAASLVMAAGTPVALGPQQTQPIPYTMAKGWSGTTFRAPPGLSANADSLASDFVSGRYWGSTGSSTVSDVLISEAVFVRDGFSVSGWFLIVHEDFTVRQHFAGTVLMDFSGPASNSFHQVSVQLRGTRLEYLSVSPKFQGRIKGQLENFLDRLQYVAFTREATTGETCMLGKIGCSDVNKNFPSAYYNIMKKLILVRLS